MKRITFGLVAAGDKKWEVTRTDENNDAVVLPGVPPLYLVPVIPTGDALGKTILLPCADATNPTAPERARDVAEMAAQYAQVTTSDERYTLPSINGVPLTKALGGYLFSTLIGADLWKAIYAGVPEQERPTPTAPLELALRPSPASGAGNTTRADGAASFLLSLPWEMLYDGSDFLARRRGIALTRRLPLPAIASPATPASLPTTNGRPRILFVVGAHPLDPSVRPGAEYLGLLRSLRAAPGTLPEGTDLLYPSTNLLLQATRADLQAALGRFKPSVVHFICHGGIAGDDGTPFIELCGDDEPKLIDDFAGDGSGTATSRRRFGRVKPGDALSASALTDIFRDANHFPQMVVLNACQSASGAAELGTDAPQIGASFAAQLVTAGVPVAVGMAGKVMDQACRLFTRTLYTALLPRVPAALPDGAVSVPAQGESLPLAVAIGRRAGIINNNLTDLEQSIDWSLPTLFLADGAGEARLSVTLAAWEITTKATDFAISSSPAFCGRADVLAWYGLLMADGAMQKALARRDTELFALRLDVPYPGGLPVVEIAAGKFLNGKVGVHRLLSEIAVHAVRDGHIPLRVDKEAWQPTPKGMSEPPRTRIMVLDTFRNAAMKTARRFGLRMTVDAKGNAPEWQWQWVARLCKRIDELDKAGILPAVLWQSQSIDGEFHPAETEMNAYYQTQTEADPGDVELLAIALRHDLSALRAAVLSKRGLPTNAPVRLLLLITKVHEMGSAVVDLFRIVFGENGMRHPSATPYCRAIFTATTNPQKNQMVAYKAINDALNDTWSLALPLSAFRAPEEWRSAYEHYLLHLDPGKDIRLTLNLPDAGRQKMAEAFFNKYHLAVGGLPSRLNNEGAELLIDCFRDMAEVGPFRQANDEDVLNKARR